MITTGPSALEIGLWVLLANVLLFLSAYALTSWWRKSTQGTVTQIGEQMQLFADRISDVLNFLQEFDDTPLEPYASPVKRLIKQIEQIGVQAQTLQSENQALFAEIEAGSTNQLQHIINAPFRWFGYWRRATALRSESQAIDAQLNESEGQVQKIYELPWEIATLARQLEQQVGEITRIAADLRQKGLRGKLLFAALSQAPFLQNTLKQVPGTFLHSDQNALLASASLDDTIRTFEAIQQVRPEVEKWLPLLSEWSQLYTRATEEHLLVQQAVSGLRQSLARPTAGLLAAPFTERVDYIASMVTGLGTRLSQPEVESLKTLQREATRLRRLAEDAGQQLSRAAQKAGELSQALSSLSTGLDSLSLLLAPPEKHPLYPLVWDESGAGLAGLRQRLSDLGPASQARTPDQINTTADEVARMLVAHKSLAEKLPKAIEQHGALVTLLESADLRDGAVWLRKTRETVSAAAPYDAKNWARPDAVTTLKADLESLAALQERLAPVDRPAQVKESTLPERLKETQQLTAYHKALRPRAEIIRLRLEKMQALEAEGKELLKSAWGALERALILIENNDILRESAESEIKRLSEELKASAKELNEPGQGVIEKKARRSQEQATAVTQALNTWLQRLNNEINTLVRQVNDQVVELDGITQLDEPAVREARSLLAREDVHNDHPLSRRPSPTGQLLRKTLSGEEASAELKRKNDLWVTLQSAQQVLTRTGAPLLAVYGEARAARNTARERLAELAERIPLRRSWPPINQVPIPDEQGLPTIDARWEAARKQRGLTTAAISELRRLQQQYQSLAERAADVLERVTQDQERISEVEDKIESLQQNWQLMAQETPENLLLIQGVQQLLSKSDSQIAYIRQQYIRGALSYGDVLRSLQLLYDEVYTARVPVDEQHDTGLSMQRSRPAR